MAAKKERNPSMELFRCLLMFGIVLLHVSSIMPPTGHGHHVAPLHVVTSFCVDAFAMISGWYSVRLTWKRVVRFSLSGWFPSLILFLVSFVIGTGTYYYSLGWFGNCYLALMLLSPLLNAAIDALAVRGRNELLRAYGAVVVIIVAMWIPLGDHIWITPIGFYSTSFGTLFVSYVTGRVMKVSNVLASVRARWLVIGFAVSQFVLLTCGALSVMLPNHGWVAQFVRNTRGNISPVPICAAVCTVLFFARLRLRSKLLCCVVKFASPSMFFVYLLHDGCNPMVSRCVMRKIAEALHGINCCWLEVILVAMITFLACFSTDCIRRSVVWCAGKMVIGARRIIVVRGV